MPRHANQTTFRPGHKRSLGSIAKQRETLRQQYRDGLREPPSCLWDAKRRARQRHLAAVGKLDRVPIGTTRIARSRNKSYIVIKVGPGRKGWVYQHRYIMEQRLGRKLKQTEHVHHRDENGLNNGKHVDGKSNLELLPAGQHTAHHAKGRPCKFKGRTYLTQWSRKHKACIQCKGTKSPHAAHGVCRDCHNREYGSRYRKRQRDKTETV